MQISFVIKLKFRMSFILLIRTGAQQMDDKDYVRECVNKLKSIQLKGVRFSTCNVGFPIFQAF